MIIVHCIQYNGALFFIMGEISLSMVTEMEGKTPSDHASKNYASAKGLCHLIHTPQPINGSRGCQKAIVSREYLKRKNIVRGGEGCNMLEGIS